MANIRDVFIRALSEGKFKVKSVNQNMTEISKATKRKSGFVKVGIDDELASDLMTSKAAAFLLYIDGDELNALNEKLDWEKTLTNGDKV